MQRGTEDLDLGMAPHGQEKLRELIQRFALRFAVRMAGPLHERVRFNIDDANRRACHLVCNNVAFAFGLEV